MCSSVEPSALVDLSGCKFASGVGKSSFVRAFLDFEQPPPCRINVNLIYILYTL